jgi:Domain of unknown function (DUF2017)
MTGIGPGSFPADDDDDPGRNGPFGFDDAGGVDDGAAGLDEDGLDAADDHDEVAATFRPIPGGAACYFAPAQAGVIRSLVGQVAELVASDASEPDPDGLGPAETSPAETGLAEAGDTGPGAPADLGSAAPEELEKMLGLSGNARLPDDPVLARLLPDAYSDNPDASAEFRRYTEESLRAGKISSARTVLASLPAGGGDVVLSEPECQQWLKALNDVRLALGVRLGITDENEDLTENLSAADPRAAYIWVYQWLAYLQDSLIESLS